MTAADSPASSPPPPRRGKLLRDLVVFQGKLFLDGVRDLLLSPASLLLGVIDLLSPSGSTPRFYRLLQLGRRSDHWIDLFGAAGDSPPDDTDAPPAQNLDGLVDRVEATLRDQLRDGELPAGARQALASRLATLRDRAGRDARGDGGDNQA